MRRWTSRPPHRTDRVESPLCPDGLRSCSLKSSDTSAVLRDADRLRAPCRWRTLRLRPAAGMGPASTRSHYPVARSVHPRTGNKGKA